MSKTDSLESRNFFWLDYCVSAICVARRYLKTASKVVLLLLMFVNVCMLVGLRKFEKLLNHSVITEYVIYTYNGHSRCKKSVRFAAFSADSGNTGKRTEKSLPSRCNAWPRDEQTYSK